jgi:hypothetical protein
MTQTGTIQTTTPIETKVETIITIVQEPVYKTVTNEETGEEEQVIDYYEDVEVEEEVSVDYEIGLINIEVDKSIVMSNDANVITINRDATLIADGAELTLGNVDTGTANLATTALDGKVTLLNKIDINDMTITADNLDIQGVATAGGDIDITLTDSMAQSGDIITTSNNGVLTTDITNDLIMTEDATITTKTDLVFDTIGGDLTLGNIDIYTKDLNIDVKGDLKTIAIINANNITLQGDNITLNGEINSTSDITINSKGNLAQNIDLIPIGEVGITSGGNFIMADGTTTTSNGDILYSVGGDARLTTINTNSNELTIDAKGNVETSTKLDATNIILKGKDITLDGEINSTGDITFTAQGNLAQNIDIDGLKDIVYTAKNIEMKEGVKTTAVGDIKYNASSEILLGLLETTENIVLIGGKVYDNNDTNSENINIISNTLTLEVASFGTKDNSIETNISILEGKIKSQGLFIVETNDLIVNDISFLGGLFIEVNDTLEQNGNIIGNGSVGIIATNIIMEESTSVVTNSNITVVVSDSILLGLLDTKGSINLKAGQDILDNNGDNLNLRASSIETSSIEFGTIDDFIEVEIVEIVEVEVEKEIIYEELIEEIEEELVESKKASELNHIDNLNTLDFINSNIMYDVIDINNEKLQDIQGLIKISKLDNKIEDIQEVIKVVKLDINIEDIQEVVKVVELEKIIEAKKDTINTVVNIDTNNIRPAVEIDFLSNDIDNSLDIQDTSLVEEENSFVNIVYGITLFNREDETIIKDNCRDFELFDKYDFNGKFNTDNGNINLLNENEETEEDFYTQLNAMPNSGIPIFELLSFETHEDSDILNTDFDYWSETIAV